MNETKIKYFGTTLGGIFLVIGILPFTWWFAILTYAWRASLYLGYWPSYGHPDPKDLPEHFHRATEMLDYLIPWGGFILLLAVLICLIHRLPSLKWKLLVSSLFIPIGWIACFALLWFDPGGFFEWIMD